MYKLWSFLSWANGSQAVTRDQCDPSKTVVPFDPWPIWPVDPMSPLTMLLRPPWLINIRSLQSSKTSFWGMYFTFHKFGAFIGAGTDGLCPSILSV